MAAKKIQEFVKGKISGPNIGTIHFNSNDEQDQSINIFKYRKLSDSCDNSERRNSKDEPSSQSDFLESNYDVLSSTRSSPGTNPKWGAQITDVKKNINTAMEDAYSAFNTLIKGDFQPDSESDIGGIRASKTMSSIEGMEPINNLSECSIMNKSLDNISQRTDARGRAASELVNPLSSRTEFDTVDFNWLPTPKNKTPRRLKKDFPEKNITLPKKVQQTFFENLEFPRSRLTSKPVERKIKWQLFTGIVVLIFSLGMLSKTLFIGFVFGGITCYLILWYYGIVHSRSEHDIISLPALRDLKSPSIPNIEENNGDDFDLYSSPQSNYSCWVNMLGMYDANTYNINQCHVVHLDIEDKQLRIRRPKKKIAHRAMWKDGQHAGLTFTSEIVIGLEDTKVDLLPKGLVHKRMWSKKYPIYIGFQKNLGDYKSDLAFADIINFKSQEIYFFGRTCRDKEELFRRLLNACSNTPVDCNMWNIVQQYLTRPIDSVDGSRSHSNCKSTEGGSRKLSFNGEVEDDSKKVIYRHANKDDEDEQDQSIEAVRWKVENTIPQMAEYVKYMSKFMPSDMFILTAKVMHLDINYVTCSPEILCINACLGRLFWDFLRGTHWVEVIRNKIQCKLKKIHLPQFMDELTVVDIHFGKEIPIIRKFSRPYLDSRGLWFDADVAYTGGFSMILETKVNLFNLRNLIKKNQLDDEKRFTESTTANNAQSENCLEHDISNTKFRSHIQSTIVDKTAALVSSEEDSAESSSYSEDSGDERSNGGSIGATNSPIGGGGSSKRLIRWVDKITRSPYFIKAADNKYVQRGMEMVSNTKLMLQVELHSLSGALAINIPPPPSDRFWYGFRPSPLLKLSAKPKVGQKEISISKITDLIEKKLILEFQRVLVLPNMDDVPLPLLVNGSLEKYISNFQ